MRKRTVSDTDILSRSVERRFKHVMVRILDEYDNRHQESESDIGRLFKIDVRNLLNDMIRCTNSEMRDYEVQYRPIKFNNDNTLSVTRTFLSSLEVIDFNDSPSVTFRAHHTKRNVIQSMRDELGAGVIYRDGEDIIYSIVGASACIDFVLPFLDRYRLTNTKAEEFRAWRARLVNNYLGDRDV